jgi:hypothetical protein
LLDGLIQSDNINLHGGLPLSIIQLRRMERS